MSKTSLRDLIIGILHDTGVPMDRRSLADHASALHTRRVTASQISTLVSRERDAYRRGEKRDVWLCHPLSDIMIMGPGDVANGVVALSAWPLEQRMWNGYSARVSAFRGALALVRAVERARLEKCSNLLALERVARRAAIAMGQLQIPYDTFDPVAARDAIERRIGEDAVTFQNHAELSRRIAGVVNQAGLSEEVLLFGNEFDGELHDDGEPLPPVRGEIGGW